MQVPRKVATANGGARYSSEKLMTYNSKYFAYGTRYSIVFYKIPEFVAHDTFCQGSDEFIMIRLSPIDLDTVFVIYRNKRAQFLSLINHEVIADMGSLESEIVSAQYSSDGSHLIILYAGMGVFQLINTRTYEIDNRYYLELPAPLFFAVYPNLNNVIVYAGEDNNLYHIDLASNILSSCGITAHPYFIKFDPLNLGNCLIITKKKKWAFISINTTFKLITTCERDDINVFGGDWIPALPGSIITGDKNHGILYIWSVSSGKMIDSFTIEDSGVSNIDRIGEKDFVVSFVSGRIGVFDVISKKFTEKVAKGHTQTVFDCQFLPMDPSVLVTAGGDGNLRFWSVPSLTQSNYLDITANSNSIFSITFSPGGGYIATGSGDGELSIYSTEKKMLLFSRKLHSSPILGLEWSIKNPSIVATSAQDKTCNLFDTKTKSVLVKVSVKSEFRRLKWSPNDNAIAIACGDGSLYVRMDGGAYYIIPGSKKPLFDVAWSFHDNNLVAATSDAGEVILFDIEKKTARLSNGHTGCARPIIWSSAVKYLVISGGYDGNLIFWDTRNMSQICQYTAHSSHIYGISYHPNQPYLIATSSRDETVRLWSIDQMFPEGKIRAALNNEKFFAKKFCPYNGSSMLEKLLRRIIHDGTKLSFADDDMVHVNDIQRLTKKRISKITTSLPKEHSVLNRAKRSKALALEAAELCLLSGNIKKYCELMFICGEFDKALALAPVVGYNFWQSLILARAKMVEGSEEDAELKLIAGMPEDAIKVYTELHQYDSALLVAAAMRQTSFEPESKSFAIEQPPSPEKPYIRTEFTQNDYLSYIVASQESTKYGNQGNPLLAAASLLTIGDVVGAVWRLIHSGELIWAIDIAKLTDCFDEKMAFIFCNYCLRNGFINESFDMLSPKIKRSLVTMIPFPSDESRTNFYKQNGFKTISDYLEESKRSRGAASIQFLLLAGRIEDALKSAIAYLKQIMSKKEYNFNDAMTIVNLIKNSAAHQTKAAIWNDVVAICHYFGIYEALWRGYGAIVSAMLEAFITVIDVNKIEWLKPRVAEMQIAATIALFRYNPADSASFSEKLPIKDSPDITSLKRIKYTQPLSGGSTVKSLGSGLVPIDLESKRCVSICSGKRIEGNVFYLEDRKTTMSYDEALMWFEVNPFSPLPSHANLSPF